MQTLVPVPFFPRGGRAVKGAIYGFFAAEVERTIDANEPGNEMLGGLGYYYYYYFKKTIMLGNPLHRLSE